jgi:hypothetical protein
MAERSSSYSQRYRLLPVGGAGKLRGNEVVVRAIGKWYG